MIITIEGKPGEGSSTLALNICKGKKFLLTEEWNIGYNFWTRSVDESIDFIIIDNVKKYDWTVNFFRSKYLQVEKQLEKPRLIEMPNIILIVFPKEDEIQ